MVLAVLIPKEIMSARVVMALASTEEKNMIPTQDEIVARIEARKETADMFGFEMGDLLEWLDYEHAKPYVKPETDPEKWQREYKPLTREAILEIMKDYMEFAWGKANDYRGLSASRSICHYTAWTWLAGDHELNKFVANDDNYQHYGKEILVKICEHYGWDHKQWDDGVRKNSEREE
jgi:hypothetical protein